MTAPPCRVVVTAAALEDASCGVVEKISGWHEVDRWITEAQAAEVDDGREPASSTRPNASATKDPGAAVDDLELATLGWVDWFNHTRLHSAIGNVPPVEYEQAHYRQINPGEQPLPG